MDRFPGTNTHLGIYVRYYFLNGLERVICMCPQINSYGYMQDFGHASVNSFICKRVRT